MDGLLPLWPTLVLLTEGLATFPGKGAKCLAMSFWKAELQEVAVQNLARGPGLKDRMTGGRKQEVLPA